MPRLSRSAWIALLFTGAVAIWMASGLLTDDRDETPQRPKSAASDSFQVATTVSHASPVDRQIVAHGDVLASRRAVIKAETAGRVAEIAVREGERVPKGQPIVQLSLEARESLRAEAQARLDKLQQDLEAARQLAERGATPRQRVRELEAQVESARAALARIAEEIRDTRIEAPFTGVVNDVAVEPGEYVAIGAALATLIDNDPLDVRVHIAQQSIDQIEENVVASVAFATGRTALGRVCFVSAAADPDTRTFPVEIRVVNPRNRTPSQISAEATIPVGQTEAHKVTAAVLLLGEHGELGIKAVEDGHVVFHPVEIVRSDTDGVWVTGLPETAEIITTGQGFVRAGEPVRVAPAEQAAPATAAAPALPSGAATTGRNRREPSNAAPPEQAAPPSCSEMPSPRREQLSRTQTGADRNPEGEQP